MMSADLAEKVEALKAEFTLKCDKEIIDAIDRTAALYDAEIGRPIDMVLFCPACGYQHIDAPDERTPDWTNPPHKSHLCHNCKHVWRPSDRPTNGVTKTQTVGKGDSPLTTPQDQLAERDRQIADLIEKLSEKTRWKGTGPVWQHKKRGVHYRELGRGTMQVNGPLDCAPVVIYADCALRLWVRPVTEFEDGRFKPLPPSPMEGGE